MTTKIADLTYIDGGMFATFIPHSKNGENAWREIASKNDGVAKIFSAHLKSTLAQLRAMGYVVVRERQDNSQEKLDDELFKELLK